MSRVYLLLGGNTGDRDMFLNMARQKIACQIGVPAAVSSVFETEPWGFSHETDFLNQLIIVETLLEPADVISGVLSIEQQLGRSREKDHYTARTIDIDILFYDDMVIDKKDLSIPHPLLHRRRFALEPLAEVEPGLVHPVFNKTVARLLSECEDTSRVEKREDLKVDAL